MNKSGPMITIRVPSQEDYDVYLHLKDVVKNKLGSDVCYTTISLYKAFLSALNELPSQTDSVEIKFLRQNVQINMGCTFNYEVKKRRRAAETHFPDEIIADGKNLFPNVINQYDELSLKARNYWFDVFKTEGIIKDTTPSTPAKREGKLHIFLGLLHRIVKQLLYWVRK